jgi:hypothetical protein
MVLLTQVYEHILSLRNLGKVLILYLKNVPIDMHNVVSLKGILLPLKRIVGTIGDGIVNLANFN